MKAITYCVTLEEPLLATALEGDPNSAVSYDYIPGSVLRGALIGMELRKTRRSELDLSDEATRRRFFSDKVRFLNAYAALNGKRSLPAPQTWSQKKYAGAADKDKVKDIIFGSSDEADEKGKPKSLRGKFVALDIGQTALIADLKRTISVHVQRDRRFGRSREDAGALFRYDALAAGQVFKAAILCDSDADADYLADLLRKNTALFLGGARTAGYGRVTISEVDVSSEWHETGEPVQVHQPIVITLLSDVIVRNKDGQYAPDLPSLCDALGIPLDSVEKAFLSQTVVGGFNRKWGLPLPQVPAISMGSMLMLGQGSLDQARIKRLTELVEHGIGERRNEGFGRLTISWQRSDRANLSGVKSAPVPKPAEVKLSASQKLWQEMQTRIQRQKSERDALAEANKLSLSLGGLPKSQINRLRQIVLSERLKPESERQLSQAIRDFFKDISGKRAGKHFEKARVNGKRMEDWLSQTVSEPNGLLIIDAVLERAAKQGSK